MSLSLKVEYMLEESEEKGGATAAIVSLNLLRRSIDVVYHADGNGGVKSETDLKMCARARRAIKRAEKDKSDVLDVSLDQLEWVFSTMKTCRDKGGVPGSIADYFLDLYEHVEKSISDAKKVKAEAKS